MHPSAKGLSRYSCHRHERSAFCFIDELRKALDQCRYGLVGDCAETKNDSLLPVFLLVVLRKRSNRQIFRCCCFTHSTFVEVLVELKHDVQSAQRLGDDNTGQRILAGALDEIQTPCVYAADRARM